MNRRELFKGMAVASAALPVVAGATEATGKVYSVGLTRCMNCKSIMAQEFQGNDVILECLNYECVNNGLKFRVTTPTVDVEIISVGRR